MLNRGWITLPVVYCRPFASKAVFWAILKDFEFAVYSNQVIRCYFLGNLNLELKRRDLIQIQRDGDIDDVLLLKPVVF